MIPEVVPLKANVEETPVIKDDKVGFNKTASE